MPESLNRLLFDIPMKRVLFYCFLFIFLITAFVTLGGITKLLPMEREYLDKLFYMLILEVVGGVTGLFLTTFKTGTEEKIADLKIQLVFPEPVDLANPAKFKVNYILTESDMSIDEIEGERRAYNIGESLYFDIKQVSLDKNLLVEVEIVGENKKYQGSENLETRSIKLCRVAEV